MNQSVQYSFVRRRRLALAGAALGIAALSPLASSHAATQAAPSPSPSHAPARPATYSERYGVLADHNIFVRDRTRLSTSHASVTSSTRPSAKSPEESLALRGVAIENGALRAYVENTSSGQVLRLSPGDTVARGRISDIDIDAIEYECNGHKQWIDIGEDFTGHPAIAGMMYSGGAPGATTTSSEPPIDPNNPNLTLEQRMKLRRQEGK